MTLSTGTKLSHYEITSQIGKGGMGEVYQATDTKLGRSVAIKVLPEEFAKDADRVARFQREAKLLASLNHPNIAAIHGLEESDGTHFLVVELIEGDTLADRIKAGAIPVEESLKLALQITEALEAAHEKGVIHRDLKPANIKVTPDGKVKVLDFGLAKAFAGDMENINLSNSPTLSDAATQQGVILGTAAYMSPEQARGKPVDRRTDVWAFGVVLYEMLTGKAVFLGKDVTDTLAAVIRSEPDWKNLPSNLHWRLKELLERCLEKEAKDRYSSINDARVDIQKVLADPSGVFAQPITAETAQKKLRTILPWVAAIIIIGIAVWILKPSPSPEPRQVHRYPYNLPDDQTLFTLSRVTISKDGTKIAYVTGDGLYLKKTYEMTERLIQLDNDSPTSPFFSHDGRWIGYLSDRQLKKIDITGGAPMKICDLASGFRGASWGADNVIVFADASTGIMQVSANGGTPEEIVKAGETEILSSPQVLPDGKSILFTAETEDGPQVVVQSLESEERKILFPGTAAQYLPTGHLVYALDYNLFAVAFEPDRLETISDHFPMDEGVFQIPGYLTLSAISDSGTLVYVPGTAPERTLPKYTLVWVDRQGKVEKIAALPDAYYSQPKISPDGKKVAVVVTTEEGSSDIHILDFNSGNKDRLTFNGNSTNPLWTPDGQRVFFVAGEGDETGVYYKNADNTGKEELLALTSDAGGPPWSWAEDGKTLVTTKLPAGQIFRTGGMGMGRGSLDSVMMQRMLIGRGRGPVPKRGQGSEESSTGEETGGGVEIGTLSMEGDHEWEPLLSIAGSFSALQISPDSRWMASSSNEPEGIFVRPFPDVGSGGLWQISTDYAPSCSWSSNGRELFYFNSRDGSLMAVEVETEPTFKKVKTNPLFTTTDIGLDIRTIFWVGYDFSPDGNRFLMLKPFEIPEESSMGMFRRMEARRTIILVHNWFEELKQKVPVE